MPALAQDPHHARDGRVTPGRPAGGLVTDRHAEVTRTCGTRALAGQAGKDGGQLDYPVARGDEDIQVARRGEADRIA
jgi:hypothetical protein